MLPDFGWTELLVIAIVLVVIVGPKDLPKMLRTFGKTTSSLRRMAGDFRKQFDDALKEAEMDDVRDLAKDVRKLDPRNEIKQALSPIGKAGREVNDELKKATGDFDKSEKKKSAAEAALDSSGDKVREAKAKAADKPAMQTKANGRAEADPVEPVAKDAGQTAKKPTPAKRAPAKSASAKSASAKTGGSTKSASAKAGSTKAGSSKSAPAKQAGTKSAASKGKPSATKGTKAKSASSASKTASRSSGTKAKSAGAGEQS